MKPVVLVVDDDTAICALLQDVLNEHVFTVSVCHTGQKAISHIECDPDIALVVNEEKTLGCHSIAGISIPRAARRGATAQTLYLRATVAGTGGRELRILHYSQQAPLPTLY